MKIKKETKEKLFLVLLGFLISIIAIVPCAAYQCKKTEKRLAEKFDIVIKNNNEIKGDINYLKDKTDLVFAKIENLQNGDVKEEDNSQKVYITENGECYHLKESCVRYPISSTLNEAGKKGLRPCSKCAE